ncbi:class I SAM-dependent methyltransferase [Arthrobacter sp. CAN_A1]|uniref:class I SAM-dependent methyltransferase n=1 Tax=Arthrobacter sp. CAN_A1 TaxID=2787717 RepID=UPI0018C9ABB1
MNGAPNNLADQLPCYAEAFSAVQAFGALDDVLWRPVSHGTVSSSRPRYGEHVLDACCGNGASALPAARLVGRRGSMHGVDLSAALTGEARERVAAEGLDWAAFTASDVTKFPVPARCFDLVQCVLGIFFLSDMNAGTTSLIRQARPGGRVAFTIWQRGAIFPVGECLVEALAPFKPALAQQWDKQADALINRINTAETYAAWLRESGLENVRIDIREHGVVLGGTTSRALVLGSGFRAMLAGLHPAQIVEVRDRYLEILMQRDVMSVDATTLVGIGKVAR